jgi:hypothetical protein
LDNDRERRLQRERLSAERAEDHTKAARYFNKRNSWLSLAAIVASSLVTVPAVGVAITNTFGQAGQGSGEQVVSLAGQWLIAALAAISTVAAAAQRQFANAERIQKHEAAAARYEALLRDIDRRDTDLKAIDDDMDEIQAAAPRIPEKFQKPSREPPEKDGAP